MSELQELKYMQALLRMGRAMEINSAAIVRLAKAVERAADGLEEPMVGLPVEGAVELQAVGVTWEDAVRVIRDTCKEAPECGPGCIMYEWCQENIPDGPAPYDWKDPPGAGE